MKGTGLGLSIARRIVRDHGGELSYEPREGGGSAFRAEFPSAAERAKPPRRTPGEGHGMNEKILVVDDEEAILLGVGDLLASEGYRVTTARDGQEALERFAADRPDLVLLDVMMPEMSGYDVCRAIRRTDPLTPVMMLTAKAEEVDKVVGLELGADDYVVKPFGTGELTARVHAALRRAHARASRLDDRAELPSIAFGDVEIDPRTLKGRRGTHEFAVTPREVHLLRLFADHEGEALDRAAILEEVWGVRYEGTTRTLDQHIVKLRQKVEADPANPRHILTVHGVGYRFTRMNRLRCAVPARGVPASPRAASPFPHPPAGEEQRRGSREQGVGGKLRGRRPLAQHGQRREAREDRLQQGGERHDDRREEAHRVGVRRVADERGQEREGGEREPGAAVGPRARRRLAPDQREGQREQASGEVDQAHVGGVGDAGRYLLGGHEVQHEQDGRGEAEGGARQARAAAAGRHEPAASRGHERECAPVRGREPAPVDRHLDGREEHGVGREDEGGRRDRGLPHAGDPEVEVEAQEDARARPGGAAPAVPARAPIGARPGRRTGGARSPRRACAGKPRCRREAHTA